MKIRMFNATHVNFCPVLWGWVYTRYSTAKMGWKVCRSWSSRPVLARSRTRNTIWNFLVFSSPLRLCISLKSFMSPSLSCPMTIYDEWPKVFFDPYAFSKADSTCIRDNTDREQVQHVKCLLLFILKNQSFRARSGQMLTWRRTCLKIRRKEQNGKMTCNLSPWCVSGQFGFVLPESET